MKTRDDYPTNLTVSWQADIGQSAPLQGEGTLAGSLAQLQIEHQVTGFAVADISATVSDVTQSPAWDASGDFCGRLEGDLRVQQIPELASSGTATINVLNGDYEIYGQQLNMERGRILFGGGPVDNPTLDMEVARNVQEFDVVAGARIQGTAHSTGSEAGTLLGVVDARCQHPVIHSVGSATGYQGRRFSTLHGFRRNEIYRPVSNTNDLRPEQSVTPSQVHGLNRT